MSCVGVEPYDAERLVARFIDGDKSHRARIVWEFQNWTSCAQGILQMRLQMDETWAAATSRRRSIPSSCFADGIRHSGTPCTQWLLQPLGAVDRGLVFDLRVKFGPAEHNDC